MALNDEEVDKQIKHMVAFINQEANEKATEMNFKAEEEFNIEKGRLVQQEKIKISAMYERKEKQVDIQKKISYSNELNQSRLRILSERDKHIQSIFNETQQQLAGISSNPDKYRKLLEGLLGQAFHQLLEENVTVRARKVDIALVEAAIPAAVKEYAVSTKKTVNVTVDKQNFLAADIAGGVEVSARGGKISVVNTLENRLKLVYKQMLPEIRSSMFGESTTRKFFD
ncbi:V-type H+ ATPase subunit E [Capsaspora owczarzaki ATCC 30864]|uniref:V-type H+ ATPase subunit E n=1 Tax=Capsaspora owczarzaki (strain ATCC 30864) TaxID=595528 RepID=A0A0D2VS47_CAPO3|nr:V-type H+ ATPase subunit E [Capsaspora owczarzaki ATCC 30864]KJE93862.1 V-type H+ ATPase subunit E [Capsaspora owczarzaki ATCC 30864]|eukprot:XP_004347333.1 V-type H+ ATPase subunit E [Capsaspora owczarzaki ATCC 30864]